MTEQVKIDQQSKIDAPSNQQYEYCILKNKVLSDMTPIFSPEISPQVTISKIENYEDHKNFQAHKYSASTNMTSPYSLDGDVHELPGGEINKNFKLDNIGQFQVEVKEFNNGNKQLNQNGKEGEQIQNTCNMNLKESKNTELIQNETEKIQINTNSKINVDNSLDNIQIDDKEKNKVFNLIESVKSKILGNDQLQQQFNNFNNFTFLKFLRARDGSIKDSTSMFVDFLQWRIDNSVDQIKDFEFNEYDNVQNVYPHGFHGVDNEGRPVWYENLGKLNLKQLMSITNEERLKKHFIKNFETLINEIFPLCSASANKPINQYIIVLDMKDHKLSLSELKNFLNMTSSITKNNYPEILYKMYIINAGSFFSVVWKGVKYILNEKTRNKVDIIGNTFIKVVNGKIPIQNIPQYVGGTCTHCTQLDQRVFSNNISQFLNK